MKIYTKTGDDGSTGLIGGARVRKSDPHILVEPPQRQILAINQIHLSAEATKDAGELHPNITTADHHHAFGQRRQKKRVVRNNPEPRRIHASVRPSRQTTRGNHNSFRRNAPPIQLQRVRVSKNRRFLKSCNAGTLQQLHINGIKP